MKVVFLTTVHQRDDTRVFHKEAPTVATIPGVELTAVVADGNGNETRPHYSIQDLGRAPGGRLGRFLVSGTRALVFLVRYRPDVVHFHDPELAIICSILRALKIKVVYDAHEDLPKDILDKYWIPRAARPVLSWMVDNIEKGAARTFSHVVAATPGIARRFPESKTTVVQNFPDLTEFTFATTTARKSDTAGRDFVYIGSMTEIRGITEIVDAIGQLDDYPESRLILAGSFEPAQYGDALRSRPGWARVDFRGQVARHDLPLLFENAVAGLVTFHPEHNHLDSQPNKLFEYMAASIPVIASDFPSWRTLLDGLQCAAFVNPCDPSAIASTMKHLLDEGEAAATMGRRGRTAVTNRFNWRAESDALRRVYAGLGGTLS